MVILFSSFTCFRTRFWIFLISYIIYIYIDNVESSISGAIEVKHKSAIRISRTTLWHYDQFWLDTCFWSNAIKNNLFQIFVIFLGKFYKIYNNYKVFLKIILSEFSMKLNSYLYWSVFLYANLLTSKKFKFYNMVCRVAWNISKRTVLSFKRMCWFIGDILKCIQ